MCREAQELAIMELVEIELLLKSEISNNDDLFNTSILCKQLNDTNFNKNNTNYIYHLTLLAFYYLKIRSFEKSIFYFSRCLELNEPSEATWVGLGRAYMGLDDWSNAEFAFLKSLELNRDSATFFSLASTYTARGMLDEALNAFLSAWYLDETNGKIAYNIGYILFAEKHLFNEAIEFFDKSINLGYQEVVVFRDAALCHLMLGNFTNARNNINVALNLSSTDAMTFLYAALIATEEDNRLEAMEYFDKALCLDGQNTIINHYYDNFIGKL